MLKKEELKEFFIHHVWQDTQENTLSFSEEGLNRCICEDDKIWMYLDEGCRKQELITLLLQELGEEESKIYGTAKKYVEL